MSQEFTAQLNKVRLSHRKTLLVENLVAGKSVAEAKRILAFSTKKGAAFLLKTLNSALAAAAEKGVKAEDVKISEIRVNKGTYLKRVKPASRGRMHKIQKPTTHILVKLAMGDKPKVAESKV
jgi:large subunit ribosomal protein L22